MFAHIMLTDSAISTKLWSFLGKVHLRATVIHVDRPQACILQIGTLGKCLKIQLIQLKCVQLLNKAR